LNLRYDVMKWNRMVSMVFLLVLGLPGSGKGQETVWTFRPGSEGWIGFWYEFDKSDVDGREQAVVVVTEVAEGSPAEAYGIHVGDVITHLDGQPISQKLFNAMSETLEPGDLVRMVIRREGRAREITVEAASPPAQIYITPNTDRVVVELEALSGNVLRTMDSLRVSLSGLRLEEREGNVSLRVLRTPADSSGTRGHIRFGFTVTEPFAESFSVGPREFFLAPELALPFEAMVVESRETQPLKERLSEVRKELTSVRRDELARRRELAAAIQGPIEEILERDARMQELQAAEAELIARHEQLADRLREVSEAEMQRHWVEIQSRSEEALLQARKTQEVAISQAQRRETERNERIEEERDRAEFEYFLQSPVIVGQSFVMGAQMVPLNPENSGYFPVDKGVFVVQVMEGSPAFQAGLQGGDIIVQVAGEEVTSLSDLRFGFGAFDGPIRIRVIRMGEPVEIVVRR
jgi:C-terminal processing protease CtpA/Prc